MKPKLTFLLSLTFLFLFSGSVYGQLSRDEVDRFIEYGDRLIESMDKQRKEHNQKQYPITNEDRKKFEEQLQLAKQGNAEAQKEVGRMYMRGLGTLRDGKKAIEWLTLSTRNGNSEAPYIIFYIFSNGVGEILKSNKEANRWLKLSAEMGYDLAQMTMGGELFFWQKWVYQKLCPSTYVEQYSNGKWI